MTFRVFAATATGSSHIEMNLPCQDAVASHLLDNNSLLIAAVCDGAGSAPLSHLGAQTIATLVTGTLAAGLTTAAGLTAMPANEFTALAIAAIDAARAGASAQANAAGAPLAAYAATLVAVAATEQGGYFIHVGDGFGVADLAESRVILSKPENGEYANETYFVTGDSWREHVRVTAIEGQPTRIALMSDGAASFVMNKVHDALFAAFIQPVETYLRGVDQATGNSALQQTLDDERTRRITTDDKALLLALQI